MLEGILQGERVHNGCQHAHVVGLSTLHATGSACHAAENIAAADNDADLMANGEQLLDLLSKMVGNLGSMPYWPSPISASPESLRSTRLYRMSDKAILL